MTATHLKTDAERLAIEARYNVTQSKLMMERALHLAKEAGWSDDDIKTGQDILALIDQLNV